jgi:hypothetical protein
MKGIVLGFVLLSACALIHAGCMVGIGEPLRKARQTLNRPIGVSALSLMLGAVFVAIILLHLAEITVWAVVYDRLDLLNSFEASFDFSIGAYTCNSPPGIQLSNEWKRLGQLESLAGLLLVGLSTAFLFLAMRKMFEMRHPAKESVGKHETTRESSSEFKV